MDCLDPLDGGKGKEFKARQRKKEEGRRRVQKHWKEGMKGRKEGPKEETKEGKGGRSRPAGANLKLH